MELTTQQKDFIRQHEQDDVKELALKLDKEKYRSLDVALVLSQIVGRQTAREKFSRWYNTDGIIYPVHLSLEQASSEITAGYKASLVPGGFGRLVDLTGGMGVDFAALSQRFEQSVYVEQDQDLCHIARHNFSVLGLQGISVVNDPGEAFLQRMEPAEMIYLDPSRRDNVGRKVVRIEECSPDVSVIREQLLAKAKLVVIKFSPMLDISLALKSLGRVSEVHVVSVENECKELLFLLSPDAMATLFHAVNLYRTGKMERFYFSPEEEQNVEIPFASAVGSYLYEPNASILKAGGFKSVAKRYGVQKLHVNSHLYTSDRPVYDFPGRMFEVRQWFVPNRQNVKQFLSQTKKANITVRNFPLSVAEIRRKTGLKEGGELYLFATTVARDTKIWVTGTRL